MALQNYIIKDSVGNQCDFQEVIHNKGLQKGSENYSVHVLIGETTLGTLLLPPFLISIPGKYIKSYISQYFNTRFFAFPATCTIL